MQHRAGVERQQFQLEHLGRAAARFLDVMHCVIHHQPLRFCRVRDQRKAQRDLTAQSQRLNATASNLAPADYLSTNTVDADSVRETARTLAASYTNWQLRLEMKL